ncbi:MAG TPA: sugar ABC transporter substrate-binding protein [Fimbriimonas sp.]|nr:sugar ABC transporter substrate-binding protein [Fimbriimonas sp.]
MLLLICFAVLVAASLAVWRLQPPADPQGRLVLTWVSDLNPLRTEQAKLFEKLHPNVRVNVDPDNGGVEKVIVQSLAGVGPDVYDAFDTFQTVAYVQSGVALDVSSKLPQEGIDLKKEVYPGTFNTCFYEGKAYGVPTNVAVDGVWYHKDLLKAAGVEPPKTPWTWDKLIPIAQKLTLKNPDGTVRQYGFLYDNWNWADFFATFGALVFSPDGSRCVLDSKPAIDAVQVMHDLVYKYHVSPSPVEQSSMATQGGFGSGTITFFGAKRGAMALGGRWWLSTLRSYKGLDMGVLESPYGTQRKYHMYGRAVLVNPSSPHLREALEFQKFMADPQYLALINHQADGIAAFERANYLPSFEFDPDHPDEKDNVVWRDIAARGIGWSVSPYLNANTASKLVQDQIDLVLADQKTAAQAMRDASKNIEEAMKVSLRDDPALKKRYEQAGGR